MAKKKIMLFIVEGLTDAMSLSTVLSRIFSSATVKFRVTHGDILTQDFISSDRIKKAVCTQIKTLDGGIYSAANFCKIVHLTDMDGVYIPDTAVIQEEETGKRYLFYSNSNILSPRPNNIIDRNQRKRDNIDRLSITKTIWGIPYSLYYFSRNLEHVLHGQCNLSKEEKIALAQDFDLTYAEDPNSFIRFMKDESFAINSGYSESWHFIKQDLHSLERFSNFGQALPEESDWSSPTPRERDTSALNTQ